MLWTSGRAGSGEGTPPGRWVHEGRVEWAPAKGATLGRDS